MILQHHESLTRRLPGREFVHGRNKSGVGSHDLLPDGPELSALAGAVFVDYEPQRIAKRLVGINWPIDRAHAAAAAMKPRPAPPFLPRPRKPPRTHPPS